MRYGSKPVDGGYFQFDDEEYGQFLESEPGARTLFRSLIGSFEMINGVSRWCLWLIDANPSQIRKLPRVLERIERVREFRLASKKEPTRRAAATPMLFTELR